MQLINSADDVQWLKDTHLSGVTLPTKYTDFKSAAILGNEDSPDYVHLYCGADPLITDAYLCIHFIHDIVYCEYVEVFPNVLRGRK